MIKLKIKYLVIFLIFTACQLESNKQITEFIEEKKVKIKKTLVPKKEIKTDTKDSILYIIGEPYFIQGVKYIPEENYNYNEIGLATFYGKELHNTKTINNDYNKVTELLGRHKTLPLPSTIKITNLENGLSLIIKINDRHDDNASIIQVSRKVAQLLRFYKNKIARVKLQILSDPSKQMKIVTESMDDPEFEKTINAAPTETVKIFDLEEIQSDKIKTKNIIETPIELVQEDVVSKNLYLQIYGFESYNQIKEIIKILNISFNFTTQYEGDNYSITIGPLENNDANKLVSSFISKGYKNTKIILN